MILNMRDNQHRLYNFATKWDMIIGITQRYPIFFAFFLKKVEKKLYFFALLLYLLLNKVCL